MNTTISKKVQIGKKHTTVLLFMMAVLMLVVSCPFKRLLQSSSEIQGSVQHAVKWNNQERKGTAYHHTSCCSLKQKTTVIKVTEVKQEVPSPNFVADLNVQSGFAIHYFLNGTDKHYNHSTSESLSSLPLFLQHRSLLI